MSAGAEGLLRDFATIWVVVDPLGSLPVFMRIAAELDAPAQRRLALEAVGIAFGVLAAFALCGGAVLSGLGVSLPSFRIAGGVVLLLFALSLIFGDDKHARDLSSYGGVNQAAAVPLAIPSLASPGAMLLVVLLAQGEGAAAPAITLGLLAAALATALAILLLAGPLHRLIGDAGAAVISRVMGMILAAVAVDEMAAGLAGFGLIPPVGG